MGLDYNVKEMQNVTSCELRRAMQTGELDLCSIVRPETRPDSADYDN